MEVRQAGSRVVNSATRVAMARERARALRLKPRRSSPLEQAAAGWEREQEARARRTEEGLLRISRKVEAHPFSLQQVALQARRLPPEEKEASWKPYLLPKREGQRRRTRLSGISVSSFAIRMIQRERAGRSRRAADPRACALEEAAMRWEARQTKQNPRG